MGVFRGNLLTVPLGMDIFSPNFRAWNGEWIHGYGLTGLSWSHDGGGWREEKKKESFYLPVDPEEIDNTHRKQIQFPPKKRQKLGSEGVYAPPLPIYSWYKLYFQDRWPPCTVEKKESRVLIFPFSFLLFAGFREIFLAQWAINQLGMESAQMGLLAGSNYWVVRF